MILTNDSIYLLSKLTDKWEKEAIQLLGQEVKIKIDFKDNDSDQSRQLALAQKVVCSECGIRGFQLTSHSRKRVFVEVRKHFVYAVFAIAPRTTTTSLGRFLYRDHSTIIALRNHAEDHMILEPDFRAKHNRIIKLIKQHEEITTPA